MIYAIGDVHGKIREYEELLNYLHYDAKNDKQAENIHTFQVGDMGVGFAGVPRPETYATDYWFAGNHDNPKACAECPGNLGDYGAKDDIDGYRIFWMRGADSIDRDQRIVGVSWWKDEELSFPDLADAAMFYLDYRPDIVFTHECPIEVKLHFWPTFNKVSKTQQTLSYMFNKYRPKKWVFGHYHMSRFANINGTDFTCLNELECKRIM